MKRKTLATLFALTAATLPAQTVNYALDNSDGTGQVNALTLTELDNSPEATFQLWFKLSSWDAATLIAQDNFSLAITQQSRMALNIGGQQATIALGGVRLDTWTHLTITYKDGTARAFINDRRTSVSGALPATISATAALPDSRSCTLGAGLKGQLDEIRIWNKALDEDNLTRYNTLNRFHPDYDNLVAYWKCDQELCPSLYDYKGGHHGDMKGISRVESDNGSLKYRTVTGYTSLIRFLDRNVITRDMFLMTNDLILLSAKIHEDGSVFIEYPDNSMTGTNAGYLAEWEGRSGLLDFGGEGAVMTAANGQCVNDPRGASSYTPTTAATVSGWIYIDQWNEGAQLFSQYKDEDNCFVVSLGSEADRALTVNVCGTTATLKGQLEPGKWQYVAVYLTPAAGQAGDAGWSPIRIAIGRQDGTGFASQLFDATTTDVRLEMAGSPMTISQFPALKGSTLTLGNGFDGKMDEVMVWGSDRTERIERDATEPYQWNVGLLENDYLNAYWKGDDPENPGKDYQSNTHMMDIIRSYYAGHRGFKIRFGLIKGSNTPDWKTILGDEEKLDRFIADCKEIIKTCDGLDVDLEWMYNQQEWNLYNHIVSRLANEVMADYPDKILSCSLHAVSYNGFDKDLFEDVDYFTMQLYGPSTNTYTWNFYENAYNNFVQYGYPKDKLLLSYGVLATDGTNPVIGYKDLFGANTGFNENYDPDVNTLTYDGTTKYFNGVTQTKRKQQFIIDNDVRGTMYFDMGNDLRVDDTRSLIRAQNDIIASNVDTLVTAVDMPPIPDAITSPTADGTGIRIEPVTGQKAVNITLPHNNALSTVTIYSPDGRLLKQTSTNASTTVSLPGTEAGTYVVRVEQGHMTHAVKIVLP